MSLSDPELDRYARHIVLPQVGGVGQNKLKAARVAVVGAGGIGSAVIPALAGAGVGKLTIIECDMVDLANLHRQPISRRDEGERQGGLRGGLRPPRSIASSKLQRFAERIDVETMRGDARRP